VFLYKTFRDSYKFPPAGAANASVPLMDSIHPRGGNTPLSRRMDGNIMGINAFFVLNYALPGYGV
jgi:hypothetical protein